MAKILVLYYISSPEKENNWKDGFTSAMDIVAKEHEVSWTNLHKNQPTRKELNLYDAIIVKSNWNWIVDNFIRKKIIFLSCKKAIMVSGSVPPPMTGKWFYDIIFYETEWYKKHYLKSSTKCLHAFGIDTDIMKINSNITKEYDWISVGKLTNYKRLTEIIEKKGKRIVIGDIDNTPESLHIHKKLIDGGVIVKKFMSYDTLVEFYQKSRNALIACELQGGGERFLLEARACNLNIEIREDNPKLESLLNCPVYDHKYYARQLEIGIKKMLQK